MTAHVAFKGVIFQQLLKVGQVEVYEHYIAVATPCHIFGKGFQKLGLSGAADSGDNLYVRSTLHSLKLAKIGVPLNYIHNSKDSMNYAKCKYF